MIYNSHLLILEEEYNRIIEENKKLKEENKNLLEYTNEIGPEHEKLYAENYLLSDQVETLEDYLLSEDCVAKFTYNEETMDEFKDLLDRVYERTDRNFTYNDVIYDGRDQYYDQQLVSLARDLILVLENQ